MAFGIPNEAQIQAMIDKAIEELAVDGAHWIDTMRQLAETHTMKVDFRVGGVDVNWVVKGKL